MGRTKLRLHTKKARVARSLTRQVGGKLSKLIPVMPATFSCGEYVDTDESLVKTPGLILYVARAILGSLENEFT